MGGAATIGDMRSSAKSSNIPPTVGNQKNSGASKDLTDLASETTGSRASLVAAGASQTGGVWGGQNQSVTITPFASADQRGQLSSASIQSKSSAESFELGSGGGSGKNPGKRKSMGQAIRGWWRGVGRTSSGGSVGSDDQAQRKLTLAGLGTAVQELLPQQVHAVFWCTLCSYSYKNLRI